MVSDRDTDANDATSPTHDIEGSLHDSPVIIILTVLFLSLVLVGALHSVFAPSAAVPIATNEDGSATATVESVIGYEKVVIRYDDTTVTLDEGESVRIPDKTEYKIVGVVDETETVLRTGST